MNHRIVLFDTSIIRGKRDQLANKFPKSEWIWTISETTDLELNKNTKDASIRKKSFKQSLEFEPLLSRGEILIKEINAYLFGEKLGRGQQVILDDNDTYERMKALINPKDYQKELTARVNDLEIHSKYFWSIIQTGDVDKFNIDDFKGYVQKLNFDDMYLLMVNGFSIIDLLQSGGKNFMASCPSCYNLYMLVAFIRTIQKPSSSKKRFTMTWSSKKLQPS